MVRTPVLTGVPNSTELLSSWKTVAQFRCLMGFFRSGYPKTEHGTEAASPVSCAPNLSINLPGLGTLATSFKGCRRNSPNTKLSCDDRPLLAPSGNEWVAVYLG
uniref:Uncharacterized protein n=1 Tax=Mus musculus TaxID=10090 RepID=Q8C8U2_MOUSE|nr:unnamed protein product [Mus musculus]